MQILSELTAISPVDGRYARTCSPLRNICSEYGLIKYRVIVEIRWFIFLSTLEAIQEIPSLPEKTLQFLEDVIENFSEEDALRIKAIEKDTNHDMKAVEYFVKEKFQEDSILTPCIEFIHFGCTSEDINNVAYGLMIKNAIHSILLPRLDAIIVDITAQAHMHALTYMMGRTHGQAATPTTIGKEFANFSYRLKHCLEQLYNADIKAKFNGAVGNYNAHAVAYPEINWPDASREFIESLQLTWNPYTTQIEPHDYIAELSHILIRCNTILIDYSKDMWSYISRNYFSQKKAEKEVGSSTMPHKINPIDFENAEGNLGIANALLEHFANKLPISRWQRDLSDSTVLRNLGTVFAHMSIAYQSILKGLDKLDTQPKLMQEILNKHWEILAEPIQVIMRRYGIDEPYEKLKVFTRGKAITADDMQHFLSNLDLPNEAKSELLALTPDNYLGLAEKLAKQV